MEAANKLTTLSLEEKLMEDVRAGKEIDVERALLIFADLETEEEIETYKLKLDELDLDFQVYLIENDIVDDEPEKVAEALHDFLWKDNKDRYKIDQFRLTEAIDAQRSLEDMKVGRCVGLTALYTVLGLRHDLDLSVLLNQGHILSRLNVGKGINIENCYPNGFNKKLKKHFNEYNLRGLLVATLIKRSCEKRDGGNHIGALNDLITALELDVNHSDLYFYIGELELSNYPKDAILDYKKSIKYDPENICPYWGLVKAKLSLGDSKGAKKYYKKALKLKPRNWYETWALGSLKMEMKDYKGAIEDYSWLISLNLEEAKLYHDRGYLREKTGDTAGALSDYDKAAELDQEYDFIMLTKKKHQS